MTKAKQLNTYKTRRNELTNSIRETMKLPDSEGKFKKMISLTKQYANLINEMNLDGFNVKVWPATFETKRWTDAYNDFVNAKKERCIKSYRSVQKTNNEHLYHITMCWTIKPDYCVCEPIINKMQQYFETLNIPSIDLVNTSFPDRTEFCETYKLTCSKETYELIMKSAKYILDITADSIYDKCNIGIFGKMIS